AGTGHGQTRRTAQQRVTCPTLITASRHDRGVAWAHAEDLSATIPQAHLEELPAPSHLFWIGPPRTRLLTTTPDFPQTPPPCPGPANPTTTQPRHDRNELSTNIKHGALAPERRTPGSARPAP